MKKMQKVWLGVFLAMFLVPEILWSPVGNFVYELSQTSHGGGTHPFRQTFLENSDNINYLSTVLFIQLLGVFITFIYLLVLNKKIKNKMVLWSVIILSFFLAVVSFFCFGLSVSLRHMLS
jgi:uncharacterized membrane protein YkgB